MRVPLAVAILAAAFALVLGAALRWKADEPYMIDREAPEPEYAVQWNW